MQKIPARIVAKVRYAESARKAFPYHYTVDAFSEGNPVPAIIDHGSVATRDDGNNVVAFILANRDMFDGYEFTHTPGIR